ncbi:hypothetical protein [Ottowia sp.]|uniref:hypothetical protein n=1 Tax=Ottowia sp. TaxID=1898956 RepID=UPI0025EAC7C9|nr:hypothetical protein [Ottowia sp.]MBK6616328.1 hypothetical protein [Ottowia sp.]
MDRPHERINRLIEAGVVRGGTRGLLSVPEFEHATGRVRFGAVRGDDGALVPGKYAQVWVEGVSIPVTYVLGIPQSSAASMDAGYEHFLALCGALGLLGDDFGVLAREPNRHAERGRIAGWCGSDLAEYVNASCMDNDEAIEGYVRPTAGQCRYEEEFAIDKLLRGEVFSSRGSAAQWLKDEIRDAFADGADHRGYACVQLMAEPVHEPVVLWERSGEFGIWDGWHRVAASLAKGARHIRAVVVEGGPRAGSRKLDKEQGVAA